MENYSAYYYDPSAFTSQRFHAPLQYLPVSTNQATPLSTSWHETDRPNNMYRTVHVGTTGKPKQVPLRRQNPYQQSNSMSSASPGGRTGTQQYFQPQQDDYMLNRVQNSLDHINLNRRPVDTDPQPVGYFNQHQNPRGPSNYSSHGHLTAPRPQARAQSACGGRTENPAGGPMTPSSYSAFVRPRSSMGHRAPQINHKAPEFCWMPSGFKTRRGMSQPVRNQPPAYYNNQPSNSVEQIQPQSVSVYPKAGEDYVPPWRGTLHSASPSAWIEGQLIDPDNPIYHRHNRHREPNPPAEPLQVIEMKEADDGRKVVHLQFNSPLQLYSQDIAKQMLSEQTEAQGGPEGTIMIKGGRPGAPPQKITQSETYRMVHAEDLRKQRRGQRQQQQHHQSHPHAHHNQHANYDGESGGMTSTASAHNGQLKVVLANPNQHQSHGGQPANSGFSDF